MKPEVLVTCLGVQGGRETSGSSGDVDGVVGAWSTVRIQRARQIEVTGGESPADS